MPMFKVLRAIFGFFVPTAPVSPAKATETVTPDLTSQVEETLEGYDPELMKDEVISSYQELAEQLRREDALRQMHERKPRTYTMRRFHARKMSKMVRTPNFH
jgi:hypothetical protein